MANSSRMRGFTIVELLTVVAIIGIVASLLMPVFARALDKAHQTTCLGNMMQIGKAFEMYAADNDQTLPDQVSGRVEDDETQTAMSTDFETYLWPYTRGKEIFRCPSDQLSLPVVLPNGKTLFNSYSVPLNIQAKSLAAIPSSASTVLSAENMQTVGGFSFNWLLLELGKVSFEVTDDVVFIQPDFRHSLMGNYLFVDGHAKAFRGPNPPFPGYKKSPDGVALCGRDDPTPP